ncbi:hypothetical protein [Actinoplanes palleronii]|nr:hypothetical protein [Actinoplanes palleronii]
MEYMTDEGYDWADDDELDLAATLGRLRELEPARIVTTPPATGELTDADISGKPGPPRLHREDSQVFVEMQHSIERATRLVTDEARRHRRLQQRLLVLMATTTTLVIALIAARLFAPAAWGSDFRITAVFAVCAIVAFLAAAAAVVVSLRRLSNTLFAEALEETRRLQSVSIALLIDDSTRRDEFLEDLAERLVSRAENLSDRGDQSPKSRNRVATR